MGYIGDVTHLITIDPNFLGHPSAEISRGIEVVIPTADPGEAVSHRRFRATRITDRHGRDSLV